MLFSQTYRSFSHLNVSWSHDLKQNIYCDVRAWPSAPNTDFLLLPPPPTIPNIPALKKAATKTASTVVRPYKHWSLDTIFCFAVYVFVFRSVTSRSMKSKDSSGYLLDYVGRRVPLWMCVEIPLVQWISGDDSELGSMILTIADRWAFQDEGVLLHCLQDVIGYCVESGVTAAMLVSYMRCLYNHLIAYGIESLYMQVSFRFVNSVYSDSRCRMLILFYCCRPFHKDCGRRSVSIGCPPTSSK